MASYLKQTGSSSLDGDSHLKYGHNSNGQLINSDRNPPPVPLHFRNNNINTFSDNNQNDSSVRLSTDHNNFSAA